jgi:coenzyme F420 hydrogenase subunit beta
MAEEFKWFLKDAIVDTGMCTYCGACAAVCPYDIIEFDENGPKLKDECYRNGEGACKDVCQRVMTDASRLSMNVFNFMAKPPSLIGQYEKIVAARATDSAIREKAQDGGAVTALLTYCFDNGLIDGAVTTAGFAEPSSHIVTNKEELMDTTGAKYSTIPVMAALKETTDTLKNVAVVGLPCHIYGTRRTQFFGGLNVHPIEVGKDGEKAKIPNIPYTIGLFCMENFNHDKLSAYFKDIGIDMDKIKRLQIHMDEMIVFTDDGDIEISLKDIAGCVSDGCRICRDAVAKVADISAGYMGSSKGWTTLMARNAKGLELLNAAAEAGYIETLDEVDVSMIEEFAGYKLRRFKAELKKRLEDGRSVKGYWVRDYPGVRTEVKGTNFVKIKTQSGLVDNAYLAKVAELSNKYGDGKLELTNRKSIEIQGVKNEDIDDIMAEVYGNGLMTIGMGFVSACPGNAYCPEGLVETKNFANELTPMFAQKLTPHKMKIAIAGCANNCVRAHRHDIGIMGQMQPKIDNEKCNGCGRCIELCKFNAISISGGKAVIDRDLCGNCGWCVRGCPHEAALEDKLGYSVWIGGNDARIPTDGILLKTFCTKEEIPALIDKIASTFVKYRTKPGKERLGNIIELVGEGQFVREVLGE